MWDRARRAGELITELRGEKKTLLTRLEELEQEVVQLRQELVKRDQLVKKLSAEASGAAASRATPFVDGEQEALVAKVKELLAKLEAYL